MMILRLDSELIHRWDLVYQSASQDNFSGRVQVEFFGKDGKLVPDEVLSFLTWLRLHPEIDSLQVKGDLGTLSHDDFECFFDSLPKNLRALGFDDSQFAMACCIQPFFDYLSNARIQHLSISKGNFSIAMLKDVFYRLPTSLTMLTLPYNFLTPLIESLAVDDVLQHLQNVEIYLDLFFDQQYFILTDKLMIALEMLLKQLRCLILNKNVSLTISLFERCFSNMDGVFSSLISANGLLLDNPKKLFLLLLCFPYVEHLPKSLFITLQGQAIEKQPVLITALLSLLSIPDVLDAFHFRYIGRSKFIVNASASLCNVHVPIQSFTLAIPHIAWPVAGSCYSNHTECFAPLFRLVNTWSIDICEMSDDALTILFDKLIDSGAIKTLVLKHSSPLSSVRGAFIAEQIRRLLLNSRHLRQLSLVDLGLDDNAIKAVCFGLIASISLQSFHFDQMQRYQSDEYFYLAMQLCISVSSSNLIRSSAISHYSFNKTLPYHVDQLNRFMVDNNESNIEDLLSAYGCTEFTLHERAKIALAFAWAQVDIGSPGAFKLALTAIKWLKNILSGQLRDEIYRIDTYFNSLWTEWLPTSSNREAFFHQVVVPKFQDDCKIPLNANVENEMSKFIYP